MKALVFLAFLSLPAHADLYRWIDPDSGSVKLSSLPPSDASINAQVVPYKAPALPKAPAAPAKPAATMVQALQAKWSEILNQITGLSPQDFQRGGEGLKQHLEAYEAVRVEIDRIDPSGAARRRAESESLLERAKRGFAAQFSPTPPGQQQQQ